MTAEAFAYGPNGRAPRVKSPKVHRQRKRRLSRKARWVAGVLTFVLTISGAAFAAWTVSGTGNGYGKVGTAAALTFSDISATFSGTPMVPGSTGDLSFKVNSTNPNPVNLMSIVGAGGITTTQQTTCPGSNVTLVTTALNDYTANNQGKPVLQVPANGSLTVTVPGALKLALTAPDACQGVGVTVPLTVNGTLG